MSDNNENNNPSILIVGYNPEKFDYSVLARKYKGKGQPKLQLPFTFLEGEFGTKNNKIIFGKIHQSENEQPIFLELKKPYLKDFKEIWINVENTTVFCYDLLTQQGPRIRFYFVDYEYNIVNSYED